MLAKSQVSHPKRLISLPQVLRLTKNLVLRDWSACPKCRGSRRTSSQGTGQSAPSVAAHEERCPKGLVGLPQVSQLTKNLVPRDTTVCPQCRGSRKTSSQGAGQSVSSVAAHEELRPKGLVSLPQVSGLTKNLVSRDWSVCPKCRGLQRTSSQGTGSSAQSVAAYREPRPKGVVSLPQVSRLTKNLVPRDWSICPKCRGSQRTSSQGSGQSAPSVAAHEGPLPKGPVSQSGHSQRLYSKRPVCPSQRDTCDSMLSHFFLPGIIIYRT